MKKRILSLGLVMLMALTVLTACHEHTWKEATCTDPKTCTVCGKAEGKPLEHSSANVTCTQDGTCDLCGQTVPATGHSWKEATCTEAKTCRTCGQTEGEPLGHSTDNGVCSRCKAEIYATHTGSGDDVVSGIEVGDGIYRVHFTNSGSSNFIVKVYTTNGGSLLVNEIGAYSGKKVVTIPSGSNAFFVITADGNWTIKPAS